MSEPFAPAHGLRCDLFCRVVDNFGDIGVCWRLARQLAREHGWRVRLLVDDLRAFARIAPDIDPAALRQPAHGVDVEHWTQDAAPETAPVEVVIEAFACALPAAYEAAMAGWPCRPVWLNLEYLSAEAWIDDCHGLPSPHPRLPLVKHFFFPGFSQRSGGLLMERDLARRRTEFMADAGNKRRMLARLGADPGARFTALVFGYPTPALASLLDAWREGATPVQCLIPGALPSGQAAGGMLDLRAIDFVPQEAFDELLWCCDFAIVRGEDSFVRAQLAGLPFAWHIYAQAGDAHLEKLRAFAGRYADGWPAESAEAWRSFCAAWNTGADMHAPWHALHAQLPDIGRRAGRWRESLAARTGLTWRLAQFVAEKLE